MSTNQELLNDAYRAVDSQLNGSSEINVSKLEESLSDLYEVCNPMAYDPSNPAGVMSVSQYAHLFNYGYEAITDSEGETFYFSENPELEGLKSQFAYLIADPNATAMDRTQASNQAVVTEALNMLVHASGQATDELALYCISLIEDALSSRNRNAAVLDDAYREIIAMVHAAFKKDDAGEVVLDRMETLLSLRSQTSLIVDANGIARPDMGKWS